MNVAILHAYNDRPIAFNRHFVTIGCGINGALMLSQAIYWSSRTNDADGWFYKTQAEWEEETGMTRREQESARKRLAELGAMHEVRRGVPAKLYYKVDVIKVHELLLSALEVDNDEQRTFKNGGKRQSGMAESANLLYTESTSETTTYKVDEIESAFDLFWNAGMVKVNKKRTQSLFASIIKKNKLDPMQFAQKISDDIKARLKAGQLGFNAMHPTTYLNGERWNDDMPVQMRLDGPQDKDQINQAAYDRLFGDDFDGVTIDV